MRNIFRGLLAFLGLTALLAAGCGPNANEGVVRVAVFTSDPSLIKILNAAAAGIESRHPGLKVRLENIPYNNYQDKITTLMAAGDAPDVISIEVGNFVDLYMRGAFEDLTPYFQKDGMDPKAYYATELKRFSPGDRLYAMPSDLAPTGLVYYNKKIFDEAGVPYPTAKWSWPEPFLSICEKLVKKDKDGKIIRWAYADPYGTIADNFLLSNGGYYTDSEDHPTRMALDRPEAIQAFQFRWDMIHTYHVSPTPSQIQAFNFGPGAESLFANGQIAMMDSGIWHTPGFVAKGLDFDVVEFPRGPKKEPGVGEPAGPATPCPKAAKTRTRLGKSLKNWRGSKSFPNWWPPA